MDNLKKLNSIGALNIAPTKKCNELIVNFEYPVVELKQLSTKHGDKVVLVLLDSEWSEFQVFLPERFKILTDKDIKQLNKLTGLKFIYRGTKECEKENAANIVEFTTN